MVLVDLIEEEFTSRAFDNIKALHALSKNLEGHLGERSAGLSEEDFIVSHLDAFFKFRNKVPDLDQLVASQASERPEPAAVNELALPPK